MSGSKPKDSGVQFAGAKREHAKDLRLLDKKAPADDSMTPHLARLAPSQILDIERMSAQGLNLDTIGVRLGFPADVWNTLIGMNPEIATAFRTGAARGQDWVSEAALRAARNGDASMMKYYLDRFGGPQFRPNDAPSVVINAGPLAVIDQDAMARRFERQRALIDGTCSELAIDTERPASAD